MGEVFRGRDMRLDRSVAIKVLPGELSRNSQLKIRFEREAKTISQLNHPHICTLYDVGDDYLVMELLEGIMLTKSGAKLLDFGLAKTARSRSTRTAPRSITIRR